MTTIYEIMRNQNRIDEEYIEKRNKKQAYLIALCLFIVVIIDLVIIFG